jgi:hypothetical protein
MAGVICLTASFGTFLPSTVKAATISNITLGTETSVSGATTVNGVTYQGFSRPITSFVSGGNNWNPVNLSVDTTLTLQRSGSAPTTADNGKQVVWERCSTTANCTSNTVRATVPTTTTAALTQNNIYLGTDNLLTNQGNNSRNQSDVERADFVLSQGYAATSDVGVTVFERGLSTGHDAFAIAAITGFDSSNNPVYSNLLGYTRGSWGTTDLLNTANGDYLDTKVLNNQTGGQFAVTTTLSQNIGGELILLTQLVSANTPVYGYSLFAYDTFSAVSNNTCTLAQLSSVTNTNCYTYGTLDTGSGATANGGGIDLLAVNLGLTAREGTTPTPTPQQVPEPLSIIGTILGGIAAFRMKKSIKR